MGPLPSWLGKLAGSLVHLDLGANQLSGPIDSVKGLVKLEYLNPGGSAKDRIASRIIFFAGSTPPLMTKLGFPLSASSRSDSQ